MKYDLIFDNVVKRYGSYELNLDLKIPKGYVTAVVGPNGSGKTTLMNLALGIIQPTSGEVEMFGENVISNESALKQHVGFVHAEDYFYPELSLEDLAQIYQDAYEGWDKKLFWHALKELEVRHVTKLGDLSTGNKKRVQAAACLAHNPDLLLLDEVFANVDLFAQKTLTKMLAKFAENEDKTIFISTNSLSDVESLIDYILVLKNGKSVLFNSKEDLMTKYVVVKFQDAKDVDVIKEAAIGFEESKFTLSAILKTKVYDALKSGLGEHSTEVPSLTDILIHVIGGKND